MGLYLLICALLLAGRSAAAEPARPGSKDCDCDPPTDLLRGAEAVAVARSATATGPVRLELFVMSLCPYGMEAERVLVPLADQWREWVDLRIYYIADEADATPKPQTRAATAREREASTGPATRAGCSGRSASTGTGPFRSLHGQGEIDEARRQLLLQADYPEAYRAYLVCRARQGPGGLWQACAAAVGVDSTELARRAAGPRGETLFRANIRHANELGVHLSPTLYVNGQEFLGDLEPIAVSRQLCRDRSDHADCAQVPVCGSDADCAAPAGQFALCRDPDTPNARCVAYDPVPFDLTVVQATACRACSTEAFLGATRELFPGGRVRHVPSVSAEGTALMRRYGIEALPAYLFSASFGQHPRFARVASMVRPVPDGFVLLPRVESLTYWPGRPRRPGGLDLFLPVWALDLEAGFVRLWKGDPGLVRVHVLPGKSAPTELPGELARRVCLAAEQPAAYRTYVLTQDTTRDAPWQTAARAAGVDLTRLQQCLASGRGQVWLAQSQAMADSLALTPDNPAALLGNRLLARRVLPARLAELALEEGIR